MPRQSSTKVLWFVLPQIILLILTVVLVFLGRAEAQAPNGSPALLATGIVGFIFVAAMIPVTLALVGRGGSAPPSADLLKEQLELLRQIHEHTMLSDSARHIAYRKNERAMLRRAIEEDIANEDWPAATVLVHEMRERFGYREEAEAYLSEIERAQADSQTLRLNRALEHFEKLLAAKDWAAAYADAARIARLFPDSHRTRDLEKQVITARAEHRKTLEREFLDAASHNDIEQAMQLLRDLDGYLSSAEAAPLQEVARGVVSKARGNLGLQFKLAVRDHDWDGAVRIGESIIEEFPNTRMAEEVRERIDILRQRAAQARSITNVSAIEEFAAAEDFVDT